MSKKPSRQWRLAATDLYLVANFNDAFSENKNIFEELKRWLS